MKRTSFALALLSGLLVGACTRTATEPTARPARAPTASFEIKTDSTQTQNTTPPDTTKRGPGVIGGGT